MFAQLARKVTAVDVGFAVGGDATHRLGQRWDAHDFAYTWATPVNEQFVATRLLRAVVQIPALPIGRTQQFLHLRGPATSDPLGNGVTFLSGADGWLQHIGQRHPAVAFDQIAPAGNSAGHANGMTCERGHLIITLAPQLIDGRSAGSTPGAVERGNLFLFCVPVKCKTVAADACHNGFHNV